MNGSALLGFENILVDETKFKNIRLSVGDVSDLISSIKSVGLLQPLVVWEGVGLGVKNKHYLIAGFRRYKALQLLREEDPTIFAQVPATLFQGNEQDARLANVSENLQRENLSHAEESEGYQELTRLGLSVNEIAKRAGKSAPWVSKLISIRQKVSPAVFRALHEGKINISLASDLTSLAVADQDTRLADLIVAVELPEEEAKALRKKARQAVKQTIAENTGRASPRPGIKKLKEILRIAREKEETDTSLFFSGVQKGILIALGEIKEIRKPER